MFLVTAYCHQATIHIQASKQYFFISFLILTKGSYRFKMTVTLVFFIKFLSCVKTLHLTSIHVSSDNEQLEKLYHCDIKLSSGLQKTRNN